MTTTMKEKNTYEKKGLHMSRQWMKKTSKCVCNLRDASFFFKRFFQGVLTTRPLSRFWTLLHNKKRERERRNERVWSSSSSLMAYTYYYNDLNYIPDRTLFRWETLGKNSFIEDDKHFPRSRHVCIYVHWNFQKWKIKISDRFFCCSFCFLSFF